MDLISLDFIPLDLTFEVVSLDLIPLDLIPICRLDHSPIDLVPICRLDLIPLDFMAVSQYLYQIRDYYLKLTWLESFFGNNI